MLKRAVILLCVSLVCAALMLIPEVNAFFAAMQPTTQVLVSTFAIALALGFLLRPRAGSPERVRSFRGSRPITDVPELTLDDVAA